MKLKYRVVAALLAIMPLAGCATLDKHENTAKLAVTYGTLKAVEQGLDPTRIRTVAQDIKALATGEAVTIASLQEVVSTQLAGMELSPADRYLADALVQAVVAELQTRIGTGILSPEQSVQVGMVLQWVIDATALYKQPAP